jgi:hypothetical protein
MNTKPRIEGNDSANILKVIRGSHAYPNVSFQNKTICCSIETERLEPSLYLNVYVRTLLICVTIIRSNICIK